MAKYLMALDQGTTGSRCILFDTAGNPVCSAAQEYTQYFPRDGWVEHDPMQIFDSQLAATSSASLFSMSSGITAFAAFFASSAAFFFSS